MKKKSFRKLVSLFALVSILFAFSTFPVQAATSSPKVNTIPESVLNSCETVINAPENYLPKNAPQNYLNAPQLNSEVKPMDVPVPWSETTNMRYSTSSYFITLEVGLITVALQAKFPKLGTAAANVAVQICNYLWAINSQSGYMDVRFYSIPSGDIYGTYYVKQHIDYYANSNHTNFICSSDSYYYSSVPY